MFKLEQVDRAVADYVLDVENPLFLFLLEGLDGSETHTVWVLGLQRIAFAIQSRELND